MLLAELHCGAQGDAVVRGLGHRAGLVEPHLGVRRRACFPSDVRVSECTCARVRKNLCVCACVCVCVDGWVCVCVGARVGASRERSERRKAASKNAHMQVCFQATMPAHKQGCFQATMPAHKQGCFQAKAQPLTCGTAWDCRGEGQVNSVGAGKVDAAHAVRGAVGVQLRKLRGRQRGWNPVQKGEGGGGGGGFFKKRAPQQPTPFGLEAAPSVT